MAGRAKRSEPCSHEGCGSRRYHLGDDGYTYCEQGHQQSEHGAVIADDTGELVITGRKQRRKNSDADSIATSRSGFTRSQAHDHYLLCVQLVLRKQIAWLMKEKDMPTNIEQVINHLWILRLQQSKSNVGYESETDDEGRSQMFSSQSEGESGTDTERSRSRRRKGKTTVVSVNDTLVLIYIGALLLRIPLCTGDICKWINSGDLLYYHSTKAIPGDLLRRLPGRYQRLLDPKTILKGETFQILVNNILSVFGSSFGMQIPAINHALLLYRWTKTLALPLEVYAAVRRLSLILDVDLKYDQQARVSAVHCPEVRLMAMIITTTNLLFPHHDPDESASSTEDLAALRLNWTDWEAAVDQRRLHDDNLTFEQAFTATETDCRDMSNERLDQYLNWYQDNIASEHASERGKAARDADFRRAILNIFPVDVGITNSSSRQSVINTQEMIADQLRTTQSKLMPRPIVRSTADHDKRIGTYYRRYHTMHDLLNGPVSARRLYELAADESGIDVDLLIRAVQTIERVMIKQEIVLRSSE